MYKADIRKAFEEFTAAYDDHDVKVLLKKIHTIHVAENCYTLAKALQLSYDECMLAYVIGILHDVGRFEQLRIYHTFFDAQSENHAHLSVKIILKTPVLKELIKHNEDLIIKAIENHNRFVIQDDLNEKERMFAHVIRDGDKLDIFRVHCEESCEAMFDCSKEKLQKDTISDAIYDEFMKEHLILNSTRKYHADILISHLAMIFDIHYPQSLIMAKEQGFYQQLLNMYQFAHNDVQRKYEQIRKKALQYLQ